jgi:lysophospholipase L1-like esterase
MIVARWAFAAFVALTCSAGARAHAQAARWVATWGAGAQPLLGERRVLEDQTLRQIVRVSRGGSELRVRLSNALGTSALKIQSASLAIREDAANVLPESLRALSFNGSSAIAIPPGATMVSDAVTLEVPDAADLAISLHLKDATTPTTRLQVSHQTSYLSGPGDFTQSASFEPASTISSWYWLSSVDVRRSEGRAIVAFGDSITEGARSSGNRNARWPDFLARRLIEAGDTHSVVNMGISGNRILHDALGPNALARLERDLLTVSGVDSVIFLEGTNDVGSSGAVGPPEASAQAIIGGYLQIASRVHDAGLRIFIGTLPPFAGSSYDTPQAQAKRQTVNTFIRSSQDFDGVIDFDKVLQDRERPSRLKAAFDSGDHLHPNDAGYQAMADAVDLTLLGTPSRAGE